MKSRIFNEIEKLEEELKNAEQVQPEEERGNGGRLV